MNQQMRFRLKFRYLLLNLLIVTVASLGLIAYQSWTLSAQSESQTTSPARVISYQGTLTNELGQPIHESLPMTFRLYDSPDAEAVLWTEVYSETTAIAVQNGQFQVWLGSQTPFPAQLWDHTALYLGIQIDDDAEMTPREQLGASPFSIQSDHATSIADYSVTSSKLSLQQQVTAITSTMPITVTSTVSEVLGTEIPATELLLTLDQPSRILYTAQIIATFNNSDATQTIQVVADGAVVHRFQATGRSLETVGISRYLDLDAGTHRLTLNYATSLPEGELTIQGDPLNDFVSYLVVDQQ